MKKVNKTHPLLPNYTGPVSGFFIFVHHEGILEWSNNILERVDYVRSDKPKAEQAARAKALQAVPLDAVSDATNTARQAYDTAKQACYTAWQAYDTARQAYATARQAYDTARQACYTAWQAYATAWLKKTFPKTDWAKLWDAKTKTLIFK